MPHENGVLSGSLSIASQDRSDDFNEPMLFVADDELPLLLRQAIIAEEVVNHPHDAKPGWSEALPLWLAERFAKDSGTELAAGYSDQLNEKLRQFIIANW